MEDAVAVSGVVSELEITVAAISTLFLAQVVYPCDAQEPLSTLILLILLRRVLLLIILVGIGRFLLCTDRLAGFTTPERGGPGWTSQNIL